MAEICVASQAERSEAQKPLLPLPWSPLGGRAWILGVH